MTNAWRAESDRIVDELIDRVPWASEIDQESREALKDTRAELYGLKALIRKHPEKKTPAVAERLDFLRKDYAQQRHDVGLTPMGRKGLGLGQGAMSLGAQNLANNTGLIMHKSPRHPEDVARRLVKEGVWDAVGAKYKREIAATENETRSDNGTT